jgi:hypothetical protein
MEPEVLLPHSQVPATCLYPSPAQSSAYPQSHFLNIRLYIIFPSTSGSPKRSLSFRFSHQNPVHTSLRPIRATCHTHLILLGFISRTRVGEEYRSLSSSLHYVTTCNKITQLPRNTSSKKIQINLLKSVTCEVTAT